MAHTAVASAEEDDIGARLSRLNLPAKPLIMEKFTVRDGVKCRHTAEQSCFCYEYLTLLDRPDYKGRWVPDSPEPETRHVGVNGGTSAPGVGVSSSNGTTKVVSKKFSLVEYQDRKSGKTPAKALTSAAAAKGSPARPAGKRPIGDPEAQEMVKNSKEVRGTPVRGEVLPRKRQKTDTPPVRTPPPVRPPPSVRPSPPPVVLPLLLSPTLPPAVEEALAQERSRAKRDEGSYEGPTARDSQKPRRTASGTSDKAKKPISSSRKPPASASNTPPRHAIASPGGKTLGAKTIPRSGLGGNTTPKPVAANSIQKRQASGSSKDQSLVVKLKFGRRRMKDVATLLRLKPNPKRVRQEEDQHLPAPPAKRQRASETLAVTSALASRSPAFKSPAKAPKERDIVTPPKKLNGKVDRNSAAAMAEVSELRKEITKFNECGRQRKHEADRTFKANSDEVSDEERQRATLVGVDSILCYMVSFLCEDRTRTIERRSPTVENWRTILAFSRYVGERTEPYPHLHGLCKQLEAIIRQHILDLDLIAFEKLPLPDTATKVPTPDSGGNVPSDPVKAYILARSNIVRASKDVRDCWLEGSRDLTCDELQRNFPKTYASRSKTFVDPARVAFRVGNYKQPYLLPLHRNSTVLEAVNFGFCFLQEYVVAEKVRFQSKLDDSIM